MNNLKTMIIIMIIFASLPIANAALFLNRCYSLTNGVTCFNGSTGQNVLTGTYLDYSYLLNAPSNVSGGGVTPTNLYNNLTSFNNSLTAYITNNYVNKTAKLGNNTDEIRSQFSGSTNISITNGVIEVIGTFGGTGGGISETDLNNNLTKQNNSILNYLWLYYYNASKVDLQIQNANTTLVAYIQLANTTMVGYVQSANTSLVSYIINTNTSMKGYVDANLGSFLRNNTDVYFGKVGIGTANPTSQLVVSSIGNATGVSAQPEISAVFHSADTAFGSNGDSAGIEVVNMNGSNNTYAGYLFGTNTSAGTVSHLAGISARFTNTATNNLNSEIGFFTRSANNYGVRVTINSSGSVGIGKAQPNYLLDVAGNINASEGYFAKLGVNTTAPTALLDVRGSSNLLGAITMGVNQGFAIYDDTATSTILAQSNHLNLLTIRTNDDIFFSVNGSEVMRIFSANGTVGIGTATPRQKLVVVGTANFTNISLAANCADGQIIKWSGGFGICGTDDGGAAGTVTETSLANNLTVFNESLKAWIISNYNNNTVSSGGGNWNNTDISSRNFNATTIVVTNANITNKLTVKNNNYSIEIGGNSFDNESFMSLNFFMRNITNYAVKMYKDDLNYYTPIFSPNPWQRTAFCVYQGTGTTFNTWGDGCTATGTVTQNWTANSEQIMTIAGAARITGTAGGGALISGGGTWNKNHSAFLMTAPIRLSQSLNSTNFFVGFSNSGGTTTVVSTPTSDLCGVRINTSKDITQTGSWNWTWVAHDGTTFFQNSTGVAADNDPHRFFVSMTPETGCCIAVDFPPKAAWCGTKAQAPRGTQVLSVIIGAKNTTANTTETNQVKSIEYLSHMVTSENWWVR